MSLQDMLQMHPLPTCAITCGLQVTQRPIPASFQTPEHPPHHSQDRRLYNKGPHPQVVAWEDRVEHWGKLSYEQGGSVESCQPGEMGTSPPLEGAFS